MHLSLRDLPLRFASDKSVPIIKKRATLVMHVYMLVMQIKQPRWPSAEHCNCLLTCLLYRHALLAFDCVSVPHDCCFLVVDIILLPLQSSCKPSLFEPVKTRQWKPAWRHHLSSKKSCRSALIPLSCISRSHMSSQMSLTPQTPRPLSRPPSMGPAKPTTPKQTHRTTATPTLSKRSMGTTQSPSLNHVRKGACLVVMVTMVMMVLWGPTQAMQHPIRPCPTARPTMHSQQLVSALLHAPSGTWLMHHTHRDHLGAYGSERESMSHLQCTVAHECLYV